MQNSPARASIDVGSVIAGTYTIEALIGRGGMGAVFLASHARLPGKKVAIKVLHAELGGDEILARFKREAQIASMLSHPNIVHIEDYNVTADGMPYLVLEYLQGESLAHRLKRGPLPIDQAFSIIRQVGSALAAAHAKGIVHRDLKPQNIFLVPSELEGRTMEIAKVLDFGISKMRDSQTVKTQDTALLGTPQYMAPEQATGQHANVDERTDIFALGAIVYEMLCGNPAFSGASIPEVVFKVVYEQPIALTTQAPNVPAAIAAAVSQAMAKPSNERFSSVNAFIEALTGTPLPPPRPSHSIPPPLEDGSGATGPRTPNNAREAFAATVGSVPPAAEAPKPIPPTPITVPATPDVRSADARSADVRSADVPSADGRSADVRSVDVRSVDVRGSAPTVDSQKISANVPPPVRSRLPVVLLALALIAGGAVAIFFATRSEKPTRVSQREEKDRDRADKEGDGKDRDDKDRAVKDGDRAVKDGDRAVKDGDRATPHAVIADAAVVTPRVDAGAPGTNGSAVGGAKVDAGVAAAKVDAGVKKHSTTTPQPPPPPPPPDDDATDANDDAASAEKLKQAEEAVRAGQWPRAEQLANAVLNSEDARPKQKARAAMIHGIVQCLGRNNEEGALTDLRRMKGAFPFLRKRLLVACQKAGFLNGQR